MLVEIEKRNKQYKSNQLIKLNQATKWDNLPKTHIYWKYLYNEEFQNQDVNVTLELQESNLATLTLSNNLTTSTIELSFQTQIDQ